MRRGRLAGLAALLLPLGAGNLPARQSGPVDRERYQFEVSVDMVRLSVTVTDEKRRLVTDLGRDDFIVYEDGAPQEIEVFSREELPLRLVILLDTSSSMRMKMSMAQEAAVRFVRSLKPQDRVRVVEFNDRVLTLVDYTSDFDAVEEAIRRTHPQGATSLYNALYISLRSLAGHRRGVERQAIVLLSDGADTRSLVSFEDVRELARKSNVIVYAISLRASEDDLKKKKYFDAKYVLDTLALETGGASYAPQRLEDLSGVYERIATELKSQYNLGYRSTNSKADGTWRHLQVFCTRDGTTVRTRTGYYAPKAVPKAFRRRRR